MTEEACTVNLRAGDALMIVDLQNDFLPGGALAVSDGDKVNTVLDALKHGYETFLLTDAIASVNVRPDDGERAIAQMVNEGAVLLDIERMV